MIEFDYTEFYSEKINKKVDNIGVKIENASIDSVNLSLDLLLVQHNKVIEVDIILENVKLINNK